MHGRRRRLDGLPLAIELAAVRTRTPSAEQIHDRLGDRFGLLTGGSRAALGTLAEYVRVRADAVLAAKPANQTFEQAASVPLAALTALQALRDHGHINPGHKVLVNGAAGGVGTFTVQLARALGAEVTGVCGPANTELVASLGASRVIDYTRQDFTRLTQRYDLLIDIAGNRPLAACRRLLTAQGILVGIGTPKKAACSGP